MSAPATGQLCVIIDQAEELEIAGPEPRARAFDALAKAVALHPTRIRVVLVLRSEFEDVFRASSLGEWWTSGQFAMPPLTQDELREIIERPALRQELSFDPPRLVDTLINKVVQAPGALPLLSFVLRELYARCAERGRDRLLTEQDYDAMGGLGGALAQSADQRLKELFVEDPAYAETARRVFLRMVIRRNGTCTRHKVSRDELLYGDAAEDARVETLLTTFKAARLLVSDRGEWEPAHDDLVQSWGTMSTWCRQVGDSLLTLQSELADAVRRWEVARRPELLWHGDTRLREVQRTHAAAGSWLNAREREFVARSRRRARRMYYIVTAFMMIVVMGGAVFWYLFYRPYVRYFASYVRHWGEPTGIDLLDDIDAHARTTNVKLVRRGRFGHTVHVELTRNGDVLAKANRSGIAAMPELEIGQPVEGERMPCQWDFEYDADTGAVSAETARDRHGRVSYVLQYHGGPPDARKAEFLDRNRFSARVKRGDAELVEFMRSPQGLDIEKRYFSRLGAPARDENGVSVEKFRYDADHIIETAFFDSSGNPLRSRYGYAGWQSRFADKGNEIQRIYFDESGRPTRHRDGYAGWRSTFDDRGNEIECEYRNESGERTRHRNGPAGWRATFDGRGREIERAYFDEAGLPARHVDGYAGQRSTFDGHDNEIERSYFDELGLPAQHKGGYTGWRSAFDEHGNEIKRDYFDEGGAPLFTGDGYAGWRSHFDELGNETERYYVDKKGQPVACMQGYAGWRSVFNARDDEIEHIYLDRFGLPVTIVENIAGWRAEFDDRGHEVKLEYIDSAGHRMKHAQGYTGWRTNFDKVGNAVERTYLDATDLPTRHRDGYAGWRHQFDNNGNVTVCTYVDERGAPTRHVEGYAGWRSKFDPWGNEIERMYFDERGEVVKQRGGYAGWSAAFDARGIEVERTYVDELGDAIGEVGGTGGATPTPHLDTALAPTASCDKDCRIRGKSETKDGPPPDPPK